MTTDTTTRRCRVCAAPIAPFMTFGRMPIANGFLTADEIASEYFFELAPAFCRGCGTVQLMDQPAAQKMFHANYAFFSSSSRHMQAHFQKFAELVISTVMARRTDPLVVELGSNDGVMLRHFKNAGHRHLGIEPSENVAGVARSQGIQTISEFFDDQVARRLVDQHGHADAVLAANVMCHIPDIHGVAAGIARLLAPDGVLMFEDPYLGDMIAKTSYDQIYDEHVFILSAASVASAFGQHGLELIDVMPQTTHGGSMRYVLAPKNSHPVAPGVGMLLEKERRQGLHDPSTYDQFRRNCEASRAALKELLDTLRREGRRVVGYGATSKSTTVTNYCGIGPEQIEFISDTTPIKQGKLTPGTHIPVKPYEAFSTNPPDYAVLFAWNHAAEIFEKEQAFKSGGGKWITFVPEVGIIG
ncbi:MAG TPA: class I SAM-dependent methyltransferase [Vicinamibacterales bacterium]|jgi:methylation protein EvaC